MRFFSRRSEPRMYLVGGMKGMLSMEMLSPVMFDSVSGISLLLILLLLLLSAILSRKQQTHIPGERRQLCVPK